MVNKWRWLGIAFALTSMLSILVTLFPNSLVHGADVQIGPIQLIVIILCVVLLLFGLNMVRKVTNTSDLKLAINQYVFILTLCVIGLVLNLISLRIYIPRIWLQKVSNLRWAIDWLVLVIAFYKFFVWRNEQTILSTIVNKIKAALIFIQSNYGVIIALVTIILCLFSDIFRGAVWVYTLFLTMGFGFSLWLISPKKRMIFAPVFAPIIGYAIASVFGSWLVMLDFPVNSWAKSYTIIIILLNLLLVAVWIKMNPFWQNHFGWKSALNDLSIGYFAVILVVLPVVIGGMKFSTFRGNLDDAHNYMSMAYYLAETRFSLHENVGMLFQVNPALYLGGVALSTRWSSSMLMAYSSFVAGIPIYRFDFAFSTLPLSLLLLPVYKIFKETRLGKVSSFLLAMGISAGYYAQMVLDSRAVSCITSLPVVLGLVFLIARIWDDKENWFQGWPIYFGEMLLLTILTSALFTLYPEILTILGLGIFIGALYYTLYRSVQVKKTILLFLSAASSILIIYVTLPSYIKFFISQITVSQDLYVSWQTHFFSWIFNDFPAGIWGLNLYQINDVLSPIIQVYAYILTAMLIVAWGVLIFRRSQTETVFQMGGFIMTAGAILFAYMYFRGQYWQAGKMFTYVYPFTMIFIAFIPYEIKGPKLPSFPAIPRLVPQTLIFFWLVLLAVTSLYRFAIVTRGMTYPFYLGGTDYSEEEYHSMYNWETQGFIDILKKTGNVVWLASATTSQDMIWALSMPSDIKVFNTHPMIGSAFPTITLNLTYLSNNLPDYLIVSNDIWRWNKNTAYLNPILFDQQFSLIKLGHQLPDVPLLIGMRNDNIYHINGDYWVGTEGWLAFLSPEKCEAILSGNGLISGKYPSLELVIDSKPSNSETVISFGDKRPFQFLIPLEKGYNLVSIKITEGLLEKPKAGPPTAYFKNMSINYSCKSNALR